MRNAYQAVVVGAGPAGSLTALLLARRGVRTLLVDKARFPRDKVCGGCLNQIGLSVLARHGLENVPGTAGGRPVHTFDLFAFGRRASFPMAPGVAVSRRAFDQSLLERASEAGAEVRDGTSAIVGPVTEAGRHIRLRHGNEETELSAGIVVLADGIGGTSLTPRGEGRWRPLSPWARVGLAALVPGPPGRVAAASVAMGVTRHGYLGIVELDGGVLDVAAAVDPGWLRTQQSPQAGIASLMEHSGLSLDGGLPEQTWAGTVPMTRRPVRRADERLFAVGDAAGYVEPFTGEGMGNALAGASRLAQIASEAARRWESAYAERWERVSRRLLSASHRRCWWIAAALRSPMLMGCATSVLGRHPALAAPLFRSIQQPALPALPAGEA